MNTTTNTRPRGLAEAARTAEEDRFRAAAPAREAARAEHDARMAEAGRIEQLALAIPDDQFAGEPEIKALRADYEAKAARMKTQLGTLNIRLVAIRDSLVASLASTDRTLETAVADDIVAGDLDLPRLAEASRRIEEDRRKLEACRLAIRSTSNGDAFMLRLRQEMQAAAHALEQALLVRKRQYVRERKS
jgi:hypothetical protein